MGHTLVMKNNLTVYEALAEKLGRNPTSEEIKAEARTITVGTMVTARCSKELEYLTGKLGEIGLVCFSRDAYTGEPVAWFDVCFVGGRIHRLHAWEIEMSA